MGMRVMLEEQRQGQQRSVASIPHLTLHSLCRLKERQAKANQHKGKLERDLAQQKKQTRTGTLENMSQDERRRRDADQTTQAINYN